MLSDYIEQYITALRNKDVQGMQRVERDLGKLGMDKYTLLTLVKERLKDGK